MSSRRALFAALAAAAVLPACSSGIVSQVLPGAQPSLIDVSYGAADYVASAVSTNQGGPILVTAFSDVGRPDAQSTFGRVLAEQIASRLSQRGFRVVDVRTVNVADVTAEGAVVLSRGARTRVHAAATALVGTYGTVGGTTYVTVRVVRLADNAVLVSHDFQVDALASK